MIKISIKNVESSYDDNNYYEEEFYFSSFKIIILILDCMKRNKNADNELGKKML